MLGWEASGKADTARLHLVIDSINLILPAKEVGSVKSTSTLLIRCHEECLRGVQPIPVETDAALAYQAGTWLSFQIQPVP